MLGRQSVRVTYAHKRRRIQTANKALFSSPLEVLPPETDDLTRTQMARRMLKRSRRVALAENVEDKNVEHIREHLAKRIKRNREHIPNVESAVPPDMLPGDMSFQTPFLPSQSIRELARPKPLVPDQLSPVPVTKRVMSRTSSRNLKENSTHSQLLASPFSSRPGSTAPSPRHQAKGRSSRHVSRISSHARSRTLSEVFKENTRQVSRKDSTASLKEADREPLTRRIKHQRYRSSPSTSHIRTQFTREDWISPPKAISRTLYDDDEFHSPGGSIHSDLSFYTDQPRSYSTPAISRLRKPPGLHRRGAGVDGFLEALPLREDATEAGDDVEMMDNTVPQRRQMIHLSRNSIFSSSGEFTIGTLPMNDGRIQGKTVADRDETPDHLSGRESVRQEAQVPHALAGSFFAEFEIPISDSPAPPEATKLGSGNVRKLSIGKVPFGLPGTSPANGGNLIVGRYRNPSSPASDLAEPEFGIHRPHSPALTTATKMLHSGNVPKLSVQELSFAGTSPAHGGNLIVRRYRNPPSSPASDLAEELSSMDIRGSRNIQSDRETHRPSAPVPTHARSHSLQGALPEISAKKSVNAMITRNRASTIRASDFARPGVTSSCIASGSNASLLPSARRTRSGTVVGPNSKLATTKDVEVASRTTKGVERTALETEPGESDDELLLKSCWIEDLEYLGLAVPENRKDNVEADEMNLGGMWRGVELCPRLGLRRR